MSKKTRRPQTPKQPRNEDLMRGMQELRRSSAAGPHRSAVAYSRKSKHRNRQDWS